VDFDEERSWDLGVEKQSQTVFFHKDVLNTSKQNVP